LNELPFGWTTFPRMLPVLTDCPPAQLADTQMIAAKRLKLRGYRSVWDMARTPKKTIYSGSMKERRILGIAFYKA
jgi:hypothetical protein